MIVEAPKLNIGDTVRMIVATDFVMLITPAGPALFYSGITRQKNALNTIGIILIAYWAWDGGETLNFGKMDFADDTIVHINAGVAGFVVAMILGKHMDYGKAAIKPFSPMLTVLGATLLWFGWF